MVIKLLKVDLEIGKIEFAMPKGLSEAIASGMCGPMIRDAYPPYRLMVDGRLETIPDLMRADYLPAEMLLSKWIQASRTGKVFVAFRMNCPMNLNFMFYDGVRWIHHADDEESVRCASRWIQLQTTSGKMCSLATSGLPTVGAGSLGLITSCFGQGPTLDVDRFVESTYDVRQFVTTARPEYPVWQYERYVDLNGSTRNKLVRRLSRLFVVDRERFLAEAKVEIQRGGFATYENRVVIALDDSPTSKLRLVQFQQPVTAPDVPRAIASCFGHQGLLTHGLIEGRSNSALVISDGEVSDLFARSEKTRESKSLFYVVVELAQNAVPISETTTVELKKEESK